jgi:hypothetical protein
MSEKVMNVLLYGGPDHGVKMDNHGGYEYIRMPVIKPLYYMTDKNPEEMPVSCTLYRKSNLMKNGRVVFFYEQSDR